MFLAGVAHPVERHLAKVEVASSSLVTRSIKIPCPTGQGIFLIMFAFWFYNVKKRGYRPRFFYSSVMTGKIIGLRLVVLYR